MQYRQAKALGNNPAATHDELREAETIMQDVVQRRHRVFGATHPATRTSETALARIRAKLADA